MIISKRYHIKVIWVYQIDHIKLIYIKVIYIKMIYYIKMILYQSDIYQKKGPSPTKSGSYLFALSDQNAELLIWSYKEVGKSLSPYAASLSYKTVSTFR
jgi:hypothetical protein